MCCSMEKVNKNGHVTVTLTASVLLRALTHDCVLVFRVL